MNVVMKSSNNNTVINTFLVAVFMALGVRSVKQQRNIDALEAEKDSLLKSNKALKKSMWEWKQQLFADAATDDSSPVPLSMIKAIYGEAPTSQQGVSGVQVEEDSRSPLPKFVV